MTVPTTEQITEMQRQLVEKGKATAILPGLSDDEVASVESKYNFKLPDDLKQFLQVGLPVSDATASKVPDGLPAFYKTANDGWHNWRSLLQETDTSKDTVLKQLSFHATPPDIEPGSYPPLIPIYCHRMIPTEPAKRGNPVLSMHGCYDNIPYGATFWDWLVQDFGIEVPEDLRTGGTPCNELPFWKNYL
eukprot:TRINITY_DN12741_c0_g1_i1.p1 TRINITY_DN12741_c0_g1~~TRINITY_DN12741_c0_g1_i1.p1  ORF type:complete len:213 (+),score=45.40 TRINITY_DN12741_c0_g1_i1:70-639(+)